MVWDKWSYSSGHRAPFKQRSGIQFNSIQKSLFNIILHCVVVYQDFCSLIRLTEGKKMKHLQSEERKKVVKIYWDSSPAESLFDESGSWRLMVTGVLEIKKAMSGGRSGRSSKMTVGGQVSFLTSCLGSRRRCIYQGWDRRQRWHWLGILWVELVWSRMMCSWMDGCLPVGGALLSGGRMAVWIFFYWFCFPPSSSSISS